MRLSSRGFSIIELAYVLTVMGLLIAVTVPAYDLFFKRARADEARTVLAAIAHAELRAFRDRGAYLACAPVGEIPRSPASFPNESLCWKDLGVQLTGEVRYRYSVELAEGTFFAVAEGDLDADGITSSFRWNGRLASLAIAHELECATPLREPWCCDTSQRCAERV